MNKKQNPKQLTHLQRLDKVGDQMEAYMNYKHKTMRKLLFLECVIGAVMIAAGYVLINESILIAAIIGIAGAVMLGSSMAELIIN